MIGFDKAKDAINIEKHGLSLSLAEEFDWDHALYALDERKDYGEKRLYALGYIHRRLHVLIFTNRNGINRIISLRKANLRERKKYEKEKAKQ